MAAWAAQGRAELLSQVPTRENNYTQCTAPEEGSDIPTLSPDRDRPTLILSALTYLLILLFGPRALNQVWIQHPQPPVLALLVTAVLGAAMGTALC